MSVIRPLAAIRYSPTDTGDISSRLAPPYDVLAAADKARLLERDARNFVAIDLPHMPPKQAGPPQAYAAARRTLDAWLAEGILVRDDAPAIYVYHQSFQHAGASFTRRMFFARLRISPFGDGDVYPHEQTFGGPKEDRLLLTQATGANLSPIFGLYEDRQNQVAAALANAIDPEKPLAHGRLAETDNRIWAVTDTAVVDQVCELMAPRSFYIADGHHRYGTAMMYRDALAAERGGLPDDDPAQFVLCVCCAMEDPGLVILPTHRVLTGFSGSAQAVFGADAALTLSQLDVSDADAAVQALAPLGPQAVGFYDSHEKAFWGLRPADPDILKPLAPNKSDAWRRLALAFLHDYLIGRTLVAQTTGASPPEISYVKSAPAATARADERGGSTFLMQATTMDELRSVCKAGDLMPQKSTYFYPKLASGLIVNPVAR